MDETLRRQMKDWQGLRPNAFLNLKIQFETVDGRSALQAAKAAKQAPSNRSAGDGKSLQAFKKPNKAFLSQ